jgi:hypothetical protein
VSRYNTSPDEVFGRGLAMQCMSDVLNLNKYQNDITLALDGSIKPTVLTKDDSIADNGVIATIPWWFCPSVTFFKLMHLYRNISVLS